jgi:hypothetical protein
MWRAVKMFFVGLLFIGLAFFNIGGCGGGGGDGCDFNILSLANGPNALQADSLWDCENTLDEMYEFSIFTDGTGASTGIGVFTWEQTGCRSIELFQDGISIGDAFNIDGNFDAAFLVYDEQLTDRPVTSADCELVAIGQPASSHE